MIKILNITNQYLVLLLTTIILLIVGYADYITDPGLYFSPVYIFPIIFMALYKDMNKIFLFLTIILATGLWAHMDYIANYNGHIVLFILNILIRFFLFTLVGHLFHLVKTQYKKLNELKLKIDSNITTKKIPNKKINSILKKYDNNEKRKT